MIGYFQCLCGTKINIANNLLTSTENISIPYIAPVNYSKISDGDMALIQLNPFQVNNYFPIPPPELAYQNTEYHESCQQLPALEIQNEETERQVFPTISNISNEIQSVVSQVPGKSKNACKKCRETKRRCDGIPGQVPCGVCRRSRDHAKCIFMLKLICTNCATKHQVEVLNSDNNNSNILRHYQCPCGAKIGIERSTY
ncbi:hypothetical protein C2G38_2139998 [Gigaspora rosea]|uniref:Zn(2)-C6 fungal-type domain-containing protein n=1 Tax=Gigaspora rosea TaxID=44941 RepID=A0A397VNQ4_9GLOM|nr:hypothetical protein C2G38_2139998 [Gigaspora rosea]